MLLPREARAIQTALGDDVNEPIIGAWRCGVLDHRATPRKRSYKSSELDKWIFIFYYVEYMSNMSMNIFYYVVYTYRFKYIVEFRQPAMP